MTKMPAQCYNNNCHIAAQFGFPGENPSSCKRHKLIGMRNLVRKANPSRRTNKCQHEGCGMLPKYSHPNKLYLTHCERHKTDDMRPSDKICKHKNDQGQRCRKFATFGYEKTPSHCLDHRDEDMDHLDKPLCDIQTCNRDAKYSVPHEKASRCERHKTPNMVDHRIRFCVVSGCDSRVYYVQRHRKFCREHLP